MIVGSFATTVFSLQRLDEVSRMDVMNRRLLVVLAMFISLVMVASGCGGSDQDDSSSADDDFTESAAGTETSDDVDDDEEEAEEQAKKEAEAEEKAAAEESEKAEKEAQQAEESALQAKIDRLGLVPVSGNDTGESVVALQERLTELGFGAGTADGSYGKRTERAIESFQGLVDLPVTGKANARTIEALATYTYDGVVLHAGDKNDDVTELQELLATGPFDPGTPDGSYGTQTVQVVWAMEKLAGIPVDGDWGPLDQKAWDELAAGELGAPINDHDQRWVEVSLSEQLMKIYDPGSTSPTLISHISSGSGVAWTQGEHSGSSVTPVGDFHVERRISGWRESSLGIGRLYNPLYFRGGIAFHGATSVPNGPASHGCVRVPMHIAEYLPSELPDGTPVHVVT